MDIDRMAKLSGMKYFSGYYTPEKWLKITGVDPLEFPKYIKVSRTGACLWTEKAERLMNLRHERIASNWASLGIIAE